MNLLDTERKSASGAVVTSTANTRLSGSWLIVARAVWLALVVPSLGLFLANIIVYYQQLQRACVGPLLCNLPGALTAQDLQAVVLRRGFAQAFGDQEPLQVRRVPDPGHPHQLRRLAAEQVDRVVADRVDQPLVAPVRVRVGWARVVGPCGAGQVDGFLAVLRLGADLESRALQQVSQVEADDRLVFRDQNAHAPTTIWGMAPGRGLPDSLRR